MLQTFARSDADEYAWNAGAAQSQSTMATLLPSGWYPSALLEGMLGKLNRGNNNVKIAKIRSDEGQRTETSIIDLNENRSFGQTSPLPLSLQCWW